jgi:hypothetical protein
LKNIGWSDDNLMDVKLMDYDYFTLLDFTSGSDELLTIYSTTTKDLIINFWNDVGNLVNLVPNYFKDITGKLKDITLTQINKYDKYAVPGLIKLINKIQIQVPYTIRDITYHNTTDIISVLKLESYNYDDVADYQKIYKFFKYIPETSL